MKDVSTLPPGLERLERAIAHQGLASRREAKDLIRSGMVKVNGKTIKEPGHGIKLESDKITLTTLAQTKMKSKESVLIYKPRGIETTATTPGMKDVRSSFPQFAHLAPIGRLDKDSEGLLILSNDGTLASALTKENSTVGKTYAVTTREHVPEAALVKMSTGISLDKVMTKPAQTKRISRTSFFITLFEGRKHQIRRMCDACRLTITSLVRTEIGLLTIGKMRPGNLRKLTNEEVSLLKNK